MTYVEKSQFVGNPIAAPARASRRSAPARILLAVFAWPVRAWRSSRDLEEVGRMNREELRDIGLTPTDVVAARCAPFHVGASIVLANLEKDRRQAAGATAGKKASQDAYQPVLPVWPPIG